MNINYNGWKDDQTDARFQLMFEAERELLKHEELENSNLKMYRVGETVVAGVSKEYTIKLRLSQETSPALIINTKHGEYVGIFFLKDVDES